MAVTCTSTKLRLGVLCRNSIWLENGEVSVFQCSWILAAGVEVVSTCTGNTHVYCKHCHCISHHFIKLLSSLSCDVYITLLALPGLPQT